MAKKNEVVPVQNVVNRIESQVAAGTITPEQGQRLITDAIETAGPDGMLSKNERQGLSADLKVDKAYTAQFVNTSPPPEPPRPEPPPRPRPPRPRPSSPIVQESLPIPPPAVPASTWDTKSTYVAPTGIRQADPDIIVFDEQIDPDFLTQAFFQEFGGTELINISRSDLINGDEVSYSPIINLSSVRQNFNPNNIIAIGAYQETPTKYGIDLFARGITDPYFDDNGDLVIEILDVRPDESIEVQIASDGTINRIEL